MKSSALVRIRAAIPALIFLLLATATATAQQAAPKPSEFPPGKLSRLEDLPAGRFRNRVTSLPAPARAHAYEVLRRFHFTELDLNSLETDPDGGVYYVDHFGPLASPAMQTAAASGPVTAAASVPATPFPSGLVFHSRPGSANRIFLNFTGKTVTGTAWNSSLGRSSIPAVAFSLDSDFTTFSDAEQQAIKYVWLRVAEDYAPFDVDVTTEPPGTLTATTAEALITRNTDNDGNANPSSTAGGVAYVSVFGSGSYGNYRPAWIYYNNLANAESYIAEAASHEIGHNLGLSHDGKTDGTEYYSGHGSGDISWGPIMGTGYNRNVSQWSKGDYYLANNTQDDLATIAAHLGYREDDRGDTIASASPLVVTGGTNIVSTRPDTDPWNAHPENKGVLEQTADVDVFSFSTGTGSVRLSVNPWLMPSGTRGGNLDVLLELHDSGGALMATNNVATATGATIQTNLASGHYYLFVRSTGTGDPMSSTPSGYTVYASRGQYFISGSIAPGAAPAAPANFRVISN
ncbi:MAG: M12 family metallo-peptidase [Verrucomicrobiota bacterium]